MKKIMRFLQMSPAIKTMLLVLLSLCTVKSENRVLSDPAFPYRVVCKPEWVVDVKNDSVLYLKNTEAGKKTRLQLQKYTVDSWYDLNNNGWSRFRFDINYSFILGVGTIGSIDSTQNKKLGGARAFEIFAYYWEKNDTGTVWWAEYVRWTDFNGIGYMASIIGDTLDLKTNVKNKTYVALLDSITLAQFSTGNAHKNLTPITVKQPEQTNETVWFDILGRNVTNNYGRQGVTISVQKNTIHCITKPKHAP
jgi:hypothetical protein